MATVFGVNATKDNNDILIPAGDLGGRVKMAYDKYTFPADAFDLGDKINMMKLPAGARVIDALVKAPSLGTEGIFKLGHAATKAEDGSTVINADDDAFVASADAGGQAVAAESSTEAGRLVKFGAETQVVLECSEATDSAEGDTIEVAIFYVLD